MRRLIDLLFAAVALILLSPLLGLIALGVMVTSPGNPFFLGPRIGKNGAPFRMWKFRTMVINAASRGPAVTGRNDPRITPLGRLLRATKLDELPQFINLLLGQMTLVGPRPEAPEIVLLYSSQQRAVLAVKPGITGIGQILGDESELIPEGVKADEYYVQQLLDPKIRRDLDYLERRTVGSDVQVLYRTAELVVRALLAPLGIGNHQPPSSAGISTPRSYTDL